MFRIAFVAAIGWLLLQSNANAKLISDSQTQAAPPAQTGRFASFPCLPGWHWEWGHFEPVWGVNGKGRAELKGAVYMETGCWPTL